MVTAVVGQIALPGRHPCRPPCRPPSSYCAISHNHVSAAKLIPTESPKWMPYLHLTLNYCAPTYPGIPESPRKQDNIIQLHISQRHNTITKESTPKGKEIQTV